MMGLCAAEGIGVIPWSPLARGRLARPWDEQGEHRAGRHGRVRQDALRQDRGVGPAGRRAGRRSGGGPRRAPGAGRAGLDAAQAGRHVADHRRDQAASPRGRDRRTFDQANAGGDRAAGAVRAAPDFRVCVMRNEPRHCPMKVGATTLAPFRWGEGRVRGPSRNRKTLTGSTSSPKSNPLPEGWRGSPDVAKSRTLI